MSHCLVILGFSIHHPEVFTVSSFFFFFHFTVNLEYGFLKQESVMLGVSCFLSLNALFHLSLTASPAGSGDLTDAMSVRVTGNPFFCCMHGLLIAGEDLLLYVLCV